MPHLDAAYNLAFWLARDERNAEDIVQEACLRAYRFIDSYDGRSGRAWLLAIVRNTFYTWLEQSRIERSSIEFDEEALAAEGYDMRSSDLAERLEKDGTDVIASSPEAFRAHIQAEIKRWAAVVKQAHLKAD